MLVPILRPIKVANVTSTTSNFNLYTATGTIGVVAGSITYPYDLYCFVNATISSTSNLTPAFQTGTGYHGGTSIYIKNSSTITGATASNGVGGAGGVGGYSTPPTIASTEGSPGQAGNLGGNSFAANTVSNLIIILDNGSGSLVGGSGGLGGGGGGGGGAAGYTLTPGTTPSKKSPGIPDAYAYYSGGGGTGGAGSPAGAGGAGGGPPRTNAPSGTLTAGGTPAQSGGGGTTYAAGAGGVGGALSTIGGTGTSNPVYTVSTTYGGRAGGPAGADGTIGFSVSGNTNIKYISLGTRTGPIS